MTGTVPIAGHRRMWCRLLPLRFKGTGYGKSASKGGEYRLPRAYVVARGKEMYV